MPEDAYIGVVMQLTIIIPCFNEEKRIGRFLDSLRYQTVRPEMIFIDGGSTDATVSMIKAYPGIKILHEDKNKRSPANARNIGIAAATGDILVSLNVDTILGERYVEKIVAAFEEHPDADAITFKHEQIIPSSMTAVGKALFLRDQIYGYDGKYTVTKTSYWRAIGKYDAELGFGEDRHIRRSCIGVPCNKIAVDEKLSVSEMSFQELGGYTKRCLWYGRTIPRYLVKENDRPIALYYLMSILFLPFAFVLSLASLLMVIVVLAYGAFRALRIAAKGYMWRELLLLPLLELYGFIYIGLGFYQFLFGNKVIGR